MTTQISGRQRTGLVLAIVLSAGNIASLAEPTPDGETGAPIAVLVVGALLGAIGVVGSVLVWRTGDRRVTRVVCGALLVMALLAVPAFFVDVSAGLKALVGAVTLLTLLTCVLLLSPGRQPAQVEYQS